MMELVVAAIAAAAVFLLLYAVITFAVPDKIELKKHDNEDKAEFAARKIGVAVDRYIFSCRMLGIKPRIGRLVACKVTGMTLSVIALPLIFMNPLIGAVVLIGGFVLSVVPARRVSELAKNKQRELEDSLPRFFDMLYTALRINMPVVQAIEQTAKCTEGVLAEELLASIAEVKMGVSSWQVALYNLAQKYETEEFTDFVLDITTAYEKGVSITDIVERKSKEIKQSSVFKAKERAAKLSSMIIFPVFILELVPVFVILFAPIVIQIMHGI